MTYITLIIVVFDTPTQSNMARDHPSQQSPLGRGRTIACPFPTTTEAFHYQASSFPDVVAVRDLSDGTRELTYQQLVDRSQALAKTLRQLGVKPGQRVPLVVKRGLEMVIGIWGILSCGGQYVPLDGGVVPDSTIRHVVDQAGGSVVLCMQSTEDRIRNLLPDVKTIRIEDEREYRTSTDDKTLLDLASPDSGCYVIYTSGTTGKPKGVDVTHKNVANLVCLSPGGLHIGPGTKVGQVLNISFDMGTYRLDSPW